MFYTVIQQVLRARDHTQTVVERQNSGLLSYSWAKGVAKCEPRQEANFYFTTVTWISFKCEMATKVYLNFLVGKLLLKIR